VWWAIGFSQPSPDSTKFSVSNCVFKIQNGHHETSLRCRWKRKEGGVARSYVDALPFPPTFNKWNTVEIQRKTLVYNERSKVSHLLVFTWRFRLVQFHILPSPPPPGISAGIWLFFLFCVLFLVPRHEKGDNSPPPGLLSTSTMSVCAIKSWQYWLLYNSKNRLTRRSRSLLRYWNVTKYLTWFHLLCIQVFRSKPISRMRGFPTVNVNLFNFIIYNRQPWILLLTKILNRRDEGFGL